MSKYLVIVESPAKAKTINKYLGRDYHVEATVGHIRNLPKSNLGVDIENNYEPKFVTIRGKADIIKRIKDKATKSKKIFIATDPDREGEAIAQDIADSINGKKNENIYRVLFNEITKSGIQKGISQSHNIDLSLVASQRARRVMDRLIGYKVSPFLWKAAIEESGNTLSAGRVQSVALRLICEREVAIQNFIPTEYWSIWGFFATAMKDEFKAKLFSVGGKEIKIPPKPKMSTEEWNLFLEKHFAIPNEETATDLYNKIKQKKNFYISNITKKVQKRNPSPPFITSTLQAEASRVLKLRPKQTMAIAQKLYEGIDLDKEGITGLITYMRTDSTRLSTEIVSETRDFISQNYGKEYLPESGNYFDKKKGSNIQDAHEAIRPTSLKYNPDFVKKFLDDNSFKLYQLIWKRFIASQMNPAILEISVIEITADEFLFKAYGQAIKFNGFMQVYIEQSDKPEDEDKIEATNEIIPLGLEKNQQLLLDELKETQHFTKALPRFTESSLIKELESKGIGRPSTYSLIASTIIDRNYVSQRERKLFPTELGIKVNSILIKNFPNIFDVGFTAKMESELDQIALGENNYIQVLNDFYFPFSSTIKQVEVNIEKIMCEKCGHEMDIKLGRFGKFLACNNYPECKNIKSLKEFSQKSNEPEYTGESCTKCGSKTVIRIGKFGRFIGCEKYPECDFIKNITLNIKCPKCADGEVIERRSKKGRIFYGCNKYPDCDFVSWNKPVVEPCPNGDSNYLEEKYSQKKGNFLKCPSCGYESVAELNEENE
jgi:DNA topoisomerase-1